MTPSKNDVERRLDDLEDDGDGDAEVIDSLAEAFTVVNDEKDSLDEYRMERGLAETIKQVGTDT